MDTISSRFAYWSKNCQLMSLYWPESCLIQGVVFLYDKKMSSAPVPGHQPTIGTIFSYLSFYWTLPYLIPADGHIELFHNPEAWEADLLLLKVDHNKW
jgi:hypothetical protein